MGRHASGLVAEGHSVTAIEVSESMVEAALVQSPAADVRQLDMRDLSELETQFDGCYLLWHSFGYFDDATNDVVLKLIAGRLRPGGRLVVDLYNPDWVRENQGSRERDGVVTTQRVAEDRQ